MKKEYLLSETYERNYGELARDVALLEEYVTRLHNRLLLSDLQQFPTQHIQQDAVVSTIVAHPDLPASGIVFKHQQAIR